jgi:sterol desaturase/sphingolipid hydroxylase (fatty acid hydroxylase superfamily)
MDGTLLNVLSFKWAPGRAPAAHHDYHHRFSNYAGKAKNYGENFTLWDDLFGTTSKSKGRNQKDTTRDF